MKPIRTWMTVVGVFYVAIFVAATFVKLPIQVFISEDVLGQVPAGDEVFRLLEDTWVMFGLELGVIGLALIIGSRVPDQARLLVWTVIGLELVRGIVDDVYMLTRGYEPTGLVVWIVIHSVIILTGLYALSTSRSARQPVEATVVRT